MSNTTAVMPDDLFRNLSEEEKEQFRAYAEANPPADANQYAISHPVCREVWDANGYGPPFGDIDPVTLVNGLHRVRRDVSNPVHDKRRSSSFRDLPVWPRGTVVYVDDDGSIFYQAGSDHPGMNGTVHSEAEGYQ